MKCGHCHLPDVDRDHVRSCSTNPKPVQQARCSARTAIISAGLAATQQRQSLAGHVITSGRGRDLRPGEQPFGPEDMILDVPGIRRTIPPVEVERAREVVRQDNRDAGRTIIRLASVKPAKSDDLYLGECDDVERCGRCAGTGQFITGFVNGKPTGPGGLCFRCAGKGRWTDCGEAAHYERAVRKANTTSDEFSRTACCDRVRNDLYDRFGIRISM